MSGFNKRTDSEEKRINSYVGKCVIITSPTSEYVGLFNRLTFDNWVVLQPHIGGHFDKDKGLVREVVDSENSVREEDVRAIRSMPKESMQAYCDYMNTHPEKNGKKK